jgi:YidC/Oxa1 family membrane protein insertase
LSGGLLLAYQTFMTSPQPPAQKTAQVEQSDQKKKAPAETKAAEIETPATPAAPAAAAPVTASKAKEIIVENQVATLVFSERGGALKKVTLKKYFNEPGEKGGNLVMLDIKNGDNLSLGTIIPKLAPQLNQRIFTANTDKLLVDGAGESSLVFTYRTQYFEVQKIYTFSSDKYDYNLNLKVTNLTDAPFEVAPEMILTGTSPEDNVNAYSFSGAEIWMNKGLEELDKGDLEDKPVLTGDISWTTINIPYFMSALVPTTKDASQKRTIRGKAAEHTMTTVLLEDAATLKPNQTLNLSYMVYTGPRDLDILEPLGHELANAIDFGWFDILAKPMLVLLNLLYGWLGNYGIAIIIVTILTKIVFWPLARKSYKSMKAMQSLQPQIMKIREKYKGDKQRMNQEVMGLYKTYKINPMGGCLPMVVQIPVFIAFYKVLGGSIELRHAPFMLWINDLSAPDRLMVGFDIPYVGGLPILTLLMGASMFLQQKMTPTPGDPAQAKMMLLMPVVFTFMFISFPSGLVLYWLVNNVLGIAQQYMTNKGKA